MSLPHESSSLPLADKPRVQMFKALTGIRAVAAVWVVVGHFAPQLRELFPVMWNCLPFTSCGFLGVDMFFVLSGFILAHNYFDEFRSVRLGSYGRFLWVRLARLYPVHLVCLFLLLGGLLAGQKAGMNFNMPQRLGSIDFVRNLLLIHAWGFADDTSWNGPAWSISAEWFAYLLFPLLTVAIVRLRSVAVAVLLSAGLYGLLLYCFKQWGTTETTMANTLALLRVGTQFTVGCLLYRVYTRVSHNPLAWELVAWGMVAALLAYVLTWPAHLYPSLAPAPLLAVLILALASAGGPISKGLSRPTMIFWGEVSYALYMTHDLVRMALNKLLNTGRFVDSSLSVRLAVLLVYAACIAAMAVLMYFIVERPARRWMRSVIGRGKPVDEAKLPTLETNASATQGEVPVTALG